MNDRLLLVGGELLCHDFVVVWCGCGVLEEGRASCVCMSVDEMCRCDSRAVVETRTHTTHFPGDCLSFCGALHRTPCSLIIHRHPSARPPRSSQNSQCTARRQKKKVGNFPLALLLASLKILFRHTKGWKLGLSDCFSCCVCARVV